MVKTFHGLPPKLVYFLLVFFFLWSPQGCEISHGPHAGVLQSHKGNFLPIPLYECYDPARMGRHLNFAHTGAHISTHDEGKRRSGREHRSGPFGANLKRTSVIHSVSFYFLKWANFPTYFLQLHFSIHSKERPWQQWRQAEEISNITVTKVTISPVQWQAGVLYVTRGGSRSATELDTDNRHMVRVGHP